MSSIYGRFLMFALACLVGAALTACGSERESEPAGESAGPAGEPMATGPAPGTSARDQVEIPSAGQLPSDFPSDVPTYPGAQAQSAMSIPGGDLFATFETSASVEDVAGYYEEQLANQGWTVVATGDKKNRVLATKGERSVSVMMMAKGAKTEVGLSVSVE
jgi:hypothetical protein